MRTVAEMADIPKPKRPNDPNQPSGGAGEMAKCRLRNQAALSPFPLYSISGDTVDNSKLIFDIYISILPPLMYVE